MAISITRENYTLHKLHSLTGVIPVGYYVAQHLVLNSFSLAGADKFNGVIDFFDSMPWYVLITLEVVAIWIPLLFHAVYGLFIVDRSQGNYFSSKYKWSQNRMYTIQRYSGVFLFIFLAIHFATTTGLKYLQHDSSVIKYAAWHAKLTSYGGAWLIFYVLGVLAASYHLCYGIWNFCIRWGITISDKAQIRIQKLSGVLFVALTLVGWLALAGFLRSTTPMEVMGPNRTATVVHQADVHPATNVRQS